MADFKYLGRYVRGTDGQYRWEQHRIAPPPTPPIEYPIIVSPGVQRAISNGRGFVARIFGDSMQPRILHHDVVVALHRPPKHREIVVVRSEHVDVVHGQMVARVWRYNQGTQAFLTKDNPAYKAQRPVNPTEIMGVVTRILPRERRHELEHYARMQECIALGDTSKHLGLHTIARQELLTQIAAIPTTELLQGRLPWGYFRGMACRDHPHVRIRAGDVLTINPTIASHVGQLVIEQHDNGELLIGIMQRERRHEKHPGEFYIDIGPRRAYLTAENGRDTLTSTIGIIERHARLA